MVQLTQQELLSSLILRLTAMSLKKCILGSLWAI